MKKPLPVSPCPSHFMSFQSEIKMKTAHNRIATQCIPPVSIFIPSPPTLSFSQSAAPSIIHYIHSNRNSLPLPLLPILQTPFPHKRPNSTLFPSTLQNSQNTPFPSPFNSITPRHSSLPPFQHPFNNHHPSASNHNTSHLTSTSTLPQTHHTLPLPFANPSLTYPQKKRKHNTRTPLPAFHYSSPFKRKHSNASLQPHDSQTVGGATLDLWLAPFVLM